MVELDHLALEEVDPLGRVGGLLEDLLLDLGDVVVDPVDDRLVVVDDLVEDRPDRRRGPLLEQVGAILEPLAGVAEVARRAVADGDHVAAREEEVDLAELDLLLGVVVARRAQDDEERVARSPPSSAAGGRRRRPRARARGGRSARPTSLSSSSVGSNSPSQTKSPSPTTHFSATSSGSWPSCWRLPSR